VGTTVEALLAAVWIDSSSLVAVKRAMVGLKLIKRFRKHEENKDESLLIKKTIEKREGEIKAILDAVYIDSKHNVVAVMRAIAGLGLSDAFREPIEEVAKDAVRAQETKVTELEAAVISLSGVEKDNKGVNPAAVEPHKVEIVEEKKRLKVRIFLKKLGRKLQRGR
jgi:hypothetical protein